MPATIPITRPITHEPVTSAPHRPQKAPISIMPSRPMLITPLRSENSPPSARAAQTPTASASSAFVISERPSMPSSLAFS